MGAEPDLLLPLQHAAGILRIDTTGGAMQCARGRQQRRMLTCDGAFTLVGCLRDIQQGIMTCLFSSTVSRALWLLPNTATKCSPADVVHPMRLMTISCMLHVCAVWHDMKSSTSCSCHARLHMHHAASTYKAPQWPQHGREAYIYSGLMLAVPTPADIVMLKCRCSACSRNSALY